MLSSIKVILIVSSIGIPDSYEPREKYRWDNDYTEVAREYQLKNHPPEKIMSEILYELIIQELDNSQ